MSGTDGHPKTADIVILGAGVMGASIAFLHPGDLGGVLTELVQFVTPV